MRWLAKAALQRLLGSLPQGERLNYVFQRHVLHSFPVADGALRQKFTRATAHIGAYEEHGPQCVEHAGQGPLAAGVAPVLVSRGAQQAAPAGVPVVASLAELLPLAV